MAIKDVFKISRKTFINPSAWLGYEEVKNSTLTLWSAIKELITPPSPQRTETFEAALKRLDLTEGAVKKTAQRYLYYATTFLAVGTAALLYGIYLLFFFWTVSGFLLAIAVAALLFAQAFRFHFWHFQIKHRKLGCTFDEWWQGKIKGHQDPKP